MIFTEKYRSHVITIIVFCAITLSQLFIYFSLIKDDPILDWDDSALLTPLYKLDSLSNYNLSRTLDIQPIRDFSLLLDMSLKQTFDVSSFHLSNFIIWIIILIIIYLILKELLLPQRHRLFLILIISVHPVFVNTVAWISARKHLLSGMFIFLATLFFLQVLEKNKKHILYGSGLWLCYIFSIFAHPITILWPFWAIVTLGLKRQLSNKYFLIPLMLCLPFTLICLYLNLSYYSTEYLAEANYFKVLPFWSNVHTVPQMYGRYFFNLIWPLNLATLYSIFSVGNLIGIALFVIWLTVLISLKSISRQMIIIWGLFYLFPLIVVTINITPIFVFDTYLLVPSFAFFFLTYLLWKDFAGRISKNFSKAILISIIVVFFIASKYEVQNWTSTVRVWENVYAKQKDSSSTLRLLDVHLKVSDEDFQPKRIKKLFIELSNYNYPNLKRDIYLRSLAFMYRIEEYNKFNLKQKQSFIQSLPFRNGPWYFHIGKLALLQQQYQKAFEYFIQALKKGQDNPKGFWYRGELLTYIDNVCELKKFNDCPILKNYLEQSKTQK